MYLGFCSRGRSHDAGSSLNEGPVGVLFFVFFIRVPYYFGDLKRDPNLESYPCAFQYSQPRSDLFFQQS